MKQNIEIDTKITKTIFICDKCGKETKTCNCTMCNLDVCSKCGTYDIEFDCSMNSDFPSFTSDYPDVICKSCWEKGKEIRKAIQKSREEQEIIEGNLFKEWKQIVED